MVLTSIGDREEKSTDVIGRFSSIEPRTPTSPHSPNGHDSYNIYTVANGDDSVFTDEKEVPKDEYDGSIVPPPPTPGTAPSLETHAHTSWSKRKVKVRDIILIIVGVVLFLGLAVGIAVTVILTSGTDSSSSEEISYNGHLTLSTPWKTTTVELQKTFVNDMEIIMQSSSLYKAFIQSSFLHLSANKTLLFFTLDFKANLHNEINQEEKGEEVVVLAKAVQTILRSQVVKNAGIIKLPIQADSVVILENIPVTSPTTVTTMTSTPSSLSSTSELTTTTTITTTTSESTPEPTTTEMTGQCLDTNFQMCHNLLGSSKFYLPNMLHHTTTQQAVDTFWELSDPKVNTDCSESSLLFLCASLFPPCDEESIPWYPCDELCQIVKNDCGNLDGWFQECESLPNVNCTASKIHETTSTTVQTTTTTTTTTEDSTMTTATPTTTSRSTTTSTASTGRPGPDFHCVEFDFPTCNEIGLNETVLPNPSWGCEDVECLKSVFEYFSTASIQSGCTTDLSFFCAYTFPGCDKADGNLPIDPCLETCQDATYRCGKSMPFPPDCSVYVNVDHPYIPCIPPQPTPTTTTTSPTPLPDRCVDQTYTYCQEEGFSRTNQKTWFADTIEGGIEEFEKWAMPTIKSNCSDVAKFFYCGIFFPHCEEGMEVALPCKRHCEVLSAQCPDAKFPMDCTVLDEDEKCLNPEKPLTTTPVATTTAAKQCQHLTFTPCTEFGYSQTTFPNQWGQQTPEEAEQLFLSLLEGNRNCDPNLQFYLCTLLFPSCEGNGDIRLPCSSYCQGAKTSCSFLQDENCTRQSDPNPDSCLAPPSKVTTTEHPTTQGPHCEPLTSTLCSHFGYSMTTFPNFWGDPTAQIANSTYYSFAEPAVASGCSDNILFYICSVLFPYCEGDGEYKLPCTSYCEEVNQNCSLLFTQDCENLSDPDPSTCLAPPERKECQKTEFSCINIDKCIPASLVCNHNNDCGDWSDERDCDCNPDFEVKCQMGLCIPSYNKCDGSWQCPDNSDEFNCVPNCTMNQYKCEPDGPCIMREWLCDGQFDCPNQDDEYYCHFCTLEEFTCTTDHRCIPFSQQCDGIFQCADHSDEMDCIHKTSPASPFYIKVGSDVVMTCVEGFSDSLGQTTCLKMGEESLRQWSAVTPPPYYKFFKLNSTGHDSSVIGKGHLVDFCPDKVVAIDCVPKECGHPSENLPSFIVNGLDALPGSWPWMVSLRKYRIHDCGGAIVHPYFVVTAAHCVDSYLDFRLLEVVAGTSRLSDFGSYGKSYSVRRAIIYPGYQQLKGDDIALLEMKEPIEYNDFVKPLCFPEKEDVFTRRNRCFIAGWGHTKGVGGSNSEHQQETKLSLWDTTKCNSSYMWNGRILANEKCAGYFNGLVAPCSGDSGSAVACQDETLTWKLVGVASYVYQNCTVPTKPMVYTSIQPYIDWIQNQTVCQFTCDNGICLFDKAMLCDTVDDCGDGSDENKKEICPISPNCTFSDKFLCGYKSKWKLVSSGGNQLVNHFPLFDHSIGKYPGKFLLGMTRGWDIKSQRIDLTAPHCMRFHYHMRGEVDQGMAVSVHELELAQWVDKWSVEKTYGPDKWLMGMFDLGPGHFDIVFRPHDNRRFAMDDIFLQEGTCQDLKCLPGEFMCKTSGTKNCLPLAVRCNIVLDCDDGQDEAGCTVPAYLCDFENGNVCGLEQHSDDTDMSEWMLVNSTQTPRGIADHTSGNDSGMLLEVNTESLLRVDQVLMSQKLQLSDVEHCLIFFYSSTSPATLQVTLEWNNTLRTLMNFTDRKTNSWIPVQATLPAIGHNQIAILTYSVIGGDLGSGTVQKSVMLDDITITRGQCPTFVCPAGSVQCEGESYCLPQSKVCDRIIDCNSGSDEINCACEKTEFKCPTGACIPITQTCDVVKNCPDGSDEGDICDGKRSVSCDFEDKFMCGYTVNTSNSEYHWERTSGKSGNQYTGPSSDHTIVGDSVLVGFYVVADSQVKGDFTALTSSPFVSQGNGLVFFYHARHFLYQVWMTGRLTLMVNFVDDGSKEELWSAMPDKEDTWKLQCITLPQGHMTISFVLQRGSGYRADIALDDIMHLETSCDQFLTDTRIMANPNPVSFAALAEQSPACSETEKACRNDMCLPAKMFCDGVQDCPDGSDEFGCQP